MSRIKRAKREAIVRGEYNEYNTLRLSVADDGKVFEIVTADQAQEGPGHRYIARYSHAKGTIEYTSYSGFWAPIDVPYIKAERGWTLGYEAWAVRRIDEYPAPAG